eukprot:CAMPEP_0185728852 /NCGR_PEP_ID=MMETSP1171-20130828/4262_1 /TAXON_ID=374046 /ORGANISM="Helicotheca tamensis, Strain CCMP826" /LENGTH=142 /DNA_ID=CAMNT_0028397601 /DNA_START=91 /DNA_END=519 /DNA_ORIENTATION=-
MQRLLASLVLLWGVLASSIVESSAFQAPSSGSRTFGMRDAGIATQPLNTRPIFGDSRLTLAATSEDEKEGEKEEEVVDIVTPSTSFESSSSSPGFSDPDAMANREMRLSWWGWIIFVYPTLLLLDDVLHFWPTEGPLSLLKI